MNESPSKSRTPGGRPPKFAEPSRPVTVTLPQRTLDDLERIDEDRARAIVKATRAAVGDESGQGGPLQVVEMVKGMGLIVVGPSVGLRSLSWLNMVEIAPSRFLLALPSGTPVEVLEVALSDLLERLPASQEGERVQLEALRRLLAKARRATSVTKAELLLVQTKEN